MTRRASARVTLVLIGAAALQGCGDQPDTAQRAQDTYLSLDECTADWGRPDYCERQQVSTPAGTSTFFRGPIYFPANRDGAQMEARDAARRSGMFISSDAPSNRAVGRAMLASPGAAGGTARGGFGSSARLFSSGG